MFLEDLYVRPNYRITGLGRMLFEESATWSRELGAKTMDFHVLNWNPVKEFYDKLGCVNRILTENGECCRYVL